MPKKKVEKKENKNMEIWNKYCETDPGITKKVNQRGGYTAVDAQAQLQQGTELFGPFGSNWGLRDLKYDFVHENSKVVGVYLVAEFYYSAVDCDNALGSFLIASDMPYKPNDDTFKKLRTDCITKALSQLGFAADVFLGRFDDSKYVAEMNKKYNKPAKKETVKPTGKCGGGKELTSTIYIPAPNDKEKTVLRAIMDGYFSSCPEGTVVNMARLEEVVFVKYGMYPVKDASVGKVLQEIPIEDVIVKNDFPGDDVIKGIDDEEN